MAIICEQFLPAHLISEAWQRHLEARRNARKLAKELGYTIQEQLQVSRHLPKMETHFILRRDGIQEKLYVITTEKN